MVLLYENSLKIQLMIDLHAHLVKTEVIGLLGGFYDEAKQELRVEISLSCDSVSTGIQVVPFMYSLILIV